MTDEQRARLRALAKAMRQIPEVHAGPLRDWWDGIDEIERAINDGPVIFSITPEERIAEAEKTLKRLGYQVPP
jgi:hypothetical protein